MLVGVEVWTERDEITVNSADVDATLDDFCVYRKDNINPLHNNDNAELIT